MPPSRTDPSIFFDKTRPINTSNGPGDGFEASRAGSSAMVAAVTVSPGRVACATATAAEECRRTPLNLSHLKTIKQIKERQPIDAAAFMSRSTESNEGNLPSTLSIRRRGNVAFLREQAR
jgi:hypothetical protein